MEPLFPTPKDKTPFVSADDVKRLRAAMGWSQAAAAREAGVSQGVVSSWERGKPPSLTAWRCYRAAAAARAGCLQNRWPPPGVHEIEAAVARIVEARKPDEPE